MSDEYTPPTEQVRSSFAYDPEDEYRDPINAPSNQRAALRAFDRWLADHDERVKAEAKKGSLPEGAKWFPDEGGIQWQGKVYFPADYVLTRSDIAKLRAEAKAEALEGARAEFDEFSINANEQVMPGASGWRFVTVGEWLDAQAAAIRAAAENGEGK